MTIWQANGMRSDGDRFALLDDVAQPDADPEREACWPLLVVDDDDDVHHATEFALHGLRVLGRPLEFVHAASAAEAIALLARRDDVALVLLDVVMESEDAGLQAVERIRGELDMAAVRIILHTGQPGYAPELEAVGRYDINDYKTKSELTRSQLVTTVTAAIRSYAQIRRLEANRQTLERIIDGTNRFDAECGLATFTDGIIAQTAVLLGEAPAGMVCIGAAEDSACDGGEECVILAAAGRHAGLVNQPLAALADPAAQEALAACLREGGIQRRGRCLALNFGGRQGRKLAACFESTAAMPEIDRHLLDIFCSNIALCGDNIGLVERLRRTAYVDDLTGLPNRVAQIEAIDRLTSEGQPGERMLALVDIDNFSETIDAFGYSFGDRQLQGVAARLRALLPVDVHVARVGGDVFGVYGNAVVVDRDPLRTILSAAFDSEAGPQTISFSIGLVRAGEADAGGAELMRNAAIALKRAKVGGPGNEAFYTPAVGEETRERVHLLHDLRAAFEGGRLFLVYQPQIDLVSGRALGVEALLRWRDESGEFVPLERFIPVAEQSGLIVGIGAWVLRTALAAQRELLAQGFRLRMAVNVSPVQFRHPAFVTTVAAAVAELAIDPALLELEITESVALHGGAQIGERLHDLKRLGVTIAIDDFGTGFSSLSYLDRLPADCLKIDRSFVHALDERLSGAQIADLVVQLGKRLGMRVLAEGIEVAAQWQTLVDMGCGEGQGWLYAPALPVDELIPWLRGRER